MYVDNFVGNIKAPTVISVSFSHVYSLLHWFLEIVFSNPLLAHVCFAGFAKLSQMSLSVNSLISSRTLPESEFLPSTSGTAQLCTGICRFIIFCPSKNSDMLTLATPYGSHAAGLSFRALY